MKPIKVIKDFTTDNKDYIVGDVIEKLNYAQIVRLNELGFIEPLTYKDLVEIKREIEKPKKEE